MCPIILIFIVCGLLMSRRKYIKRCKRKMYNENLEYRQRIIGGGHAGGIVGRNDNDTDIIHTDLPLMSIGSEFKFNKDLDSKWEFPRTQLVFDIVLGEGEFGKVVKAYATNISDKSGITTVAVKMLKTGANSVELLALLSEYQLLQEVSHPNVIRLLGACTQGDSPLLIIEYAKYGSLRNYLRLSRKLECNGIEFSNGVEPITVKDILSFAWQICKGMAYLTEIKVRAKTYIKYI